MSDLREGFEAWANGEGHATLRQCVGGPYDSGEIQVAWESWQAALATSDSTTAMRILCERLRVAEGALDDARDYVASALTCYNRDGKLCQLCLDRLELFCAGDAELAKEQP